MKHKNKYGGFSEDSKEYIITDPKTPRPWFNYMWNDRYMALLSHTGGGFSFYDTPRDNRLTRMRYNCLPWDRPGRYVLVKERGTAEHWSLSWAPTTDIEYASYECRHGFGYSIIKTEYRGVRGEITYFVPQDADCEIWRVKIANNSDAVKKLELYGFTELMMGNALNDIINQPNDKHFTDIRFDRKLKALNCTRRYWVLNRKVSVEQPNLDWKYRLLFGCSNTITGFDGSLDSFIGRWRSEANPIAVEKGKMSNTEITAGEPVAALQTRVTLNPGQEKELVFVMAIFPKEQLTRKTQAEWKRICSVTYAEKAFERLGDKWKQNLSCFSLTTPDPKINTMLGYWNQYQAAVTFDMARNSGYYHGGLLFGTGMRDQFQDILGVVLSEPERVRKRILNALRFQFKDGSTLHNFFKLTDWGEKTNHSDTPLWIPFGIIEYLNETGDFSILDENVTYYDGGSGTVFEHLKGAVEFAYSATSPRGIPKMMNGDWNDTLDKVGPKGKGETVWGGFFLAYIIRKTWELLKYKNDTGTLKRWKKIYARLGRVINDVAWDGEWYIRAFRDNGKPLGSKNARQGKIFINAQTWSVISGLAPQERASKSLASLRKHLLRENGIQICSPSYTTVEEDVGLISRCVPGKKENGAIFNHASSWYVLAALLNGEVESAFSVYSSMLPINSASRIDRYEIEPYVFAEYLTSPDHPSEGQASHSWLTGTAVWMLRIGMDHIIGFRTTLHGIHINPHIPAHWKSFRATRKFRGKILNLSVKNPNGKNAGLSKLLVNGKSVLSSFIDVAAFSGEVIDIELTL